MSELQPIKEQIRIIGFNSVYYFEHGKEFYHPSGNGYEVKVKEHMQRIKREAKENT